MEFMCKKISISDEEFGCTISFSDTIEQYDFEKEINIKSVKALKEKVVKVAKEKVVKEKVVKEKVVKVAKEKVVKEKVLKVAKEKVVKKIIGV